MLTDHIDRRGGITGAGQQTIRAADDLHPFEKSHIGKRVAQIPAGFKPGRNAIDHIVIDLKTTRVVAGAVRICLAAADPHGVLHHITQRLQLLIAHPLFGDDTDRLRDIALGHLHFCPCGGSFDAVILFLRIRSAICGTFYNNSVFGVTGSLAKVWGERQRYAHRKQGWSVSPIPGVSGERHHKPLIMR